MQFASAVMLAAVLAGVVGVATSGLANETKFATTSVDRMHKGDRLSPASSIAWPQDNSKATKAPTIVPAGVIGHSARWLNRNVHEYLVDALHDANLTLFSYGPYFK